MHTPVLLQQAIENLQIRKDGLYIDATYGEGGYSNEILKLGGKVLAIDWDENQISNIKDQISKLKLVSGNFADIEKLAKENDFCPADGVVFDLGLSWNQLDKSGRGFSYRKLNEPLDMRIDITNPVTALDVIRKSSEEKLYGIFAKNSEELKSKAIAQSVKSSRRMETVRDLLQAIDKAAGFSSNTIYARIFQALRIEVNHEMDNLKKGLSGATRIVKKGGRIVVVSFHSLEDRIVKNFCRENSLNLISKKPVTNKNGPSFEKGAKLRTILI